MQNLLFLLLGWLLGLFAPIIVDGIRRRRRMAQARSTISTELAEVRLKIAFTAFIIAKRFGTLDRPLLQWIKSIVDVYSGPHADQDKTNAIKRLLELSDEELAEIAEHSIAGPLGAIALKKFPTPFLDSHIGILLSLDGELQTLIIEIKAQIGLLNEHVEFSQFYFQKTFDSNLSHDNYKIIQQNLNDTYMQIYERARGNADLITRFLKESKK